MAFRSIEPDDGHGARSRATIALPGIVRATTVLLDDISRRLDADRPSDVAIAFAVPVADAVRRIEDACARRGAGPEDMATPSRRSYALLAFLSSDGLLRRYAEQTLTVKGQIRSLIRSSTPAPCSVRLDDLVGLYRYRLRPGEWYFRLNPGFLAADRDLMRAVVRDALFGRRKERRRLLHEFMRDERFLSIVQDIEDIAAGSPILAGQYYDLDEVCETIRARMFRPPVERPASLAWTDRLTYTCFGHYNALRDRITVSRSLDDARVPRYVVEYIMFHELLHKVHGIGWAVARRTMHTRAFRADERSFPRTEEARKFLHKWGAHIRGKIAARVATGRE